MNKLKLIKNEELIEKERADKILDKIKKPYDLEEVVNNKKDNKEVNGDTLDRIKDFLGLKAKKVYLDNIKNGVYSYTFRINTSQCIICYNDIYNESMGTLAILDINEDSIIRNDSIEIGLISDIKMIQISNNKYIIVYRYSDKDSLYYRIVNIGNNINIEDEKIILEKVKDINFDISKFSKSKFIIVYKFNNDKIIYSTIINILNNEFIKQVPSINNDGNKFIEFNIQYIPSNKALLTCIYETNTDMIELTEYKKSIVASYINPNFKSNIGIIHPKDNINVELLKNNLLIFGFRDVNNIANVYIYDAKRYQEITIPIDLKNTIDEIKLFKSLNNKQISIILKYTDKNVYTYLLLNIYVKDSIIYTDVIDTVDLTNIIDHCNVDIVNINKLDFMSISNDKNSNLDLTIKRFEAIDQTKGNLK